MATLLGILPQNISNRYRLLGSVRRLKFGSLGLFEKITYYQIFLSEPTWAVQCDIVGAVVELSEQFFRESIHRNFLFITASILLVQTQYRHHSSRFPERFKFRAPRGSAQEDGFRERWGSFYRINDNKCRQALTKFQ